MARLLMLSPLVSANGIDASTDANAVLYADNISVTPTSTNDQTIAGSANFNQENYTFGYGTGDLTVNRRAAQIIASAQQKDYGDVHDLGDASFTVVDRDGGALPNGETVNTVTLVSADGVDASTDANAVLYRDNISVTPTSTNDQTIAGSANFNQENYTFGYGTGDLTINRRAITLTATQQEKIYGDQLALDDTVFTTFDKDGDAVLPNGEVVTNVTINSATGVDASTTSDVATYADEIVISGPVAGTDGSGDGFLESNYDISYVAGDLTVNRRAAQIIANAQRKDYGDVHDLGSTAFTVVDRDGGALPNGETIDTVTLVSGGGVDSSTDADTGTYSNDLSITPTSTATSTLTGTNGFDQENYLFSYNTGDLVINQRAITLTASQQEKIYGNVLNLDDTAFTTLDKDGDSALPNGEVVTNVTIGSATGVDASTSSDVTTYTDEINIESPVVGTAGTGDGFLESNYDITYVSGDLKVNPRPITVTPTQQEKIYGNTLTLDQTAFTVTDLDNDALLPNGESIDTVSVISRGAHDASTTSSAVTYADDLEATSVATSSAGFDLNNYTIDFSNLSDLVINRRAVTLTALQQEKDYGDVHTLDTTTFSVTDLDNDALLPNGETIDTVTLVSGGGVDSSTDADTGTYSNDLSITPTSTATSTLTGTNGFDQENYLFSYNTGDLVINQRAITLTASQQEKIYGNVLNLDDTAFTTLDKDGDSALPNGEVVTNVTIGSATGVDASTSSDVTTYTDEINIESPVVGTAGTGDGFLESNYDITYVSGDLKVNPRPITVTPTQQEKIYGNTLTLDQTAFTVTDLDNDALLPNGESIDTVSVISRGAHDASTTSSAVTYADDLEATSVATSSAGFDLNNYTIDFSNLSDLVINQRAILLTAQDQSKIYGNTDTLEDAAFTVIDTFGGGGTNLPNGESIDAVSFAATTLPGDTTAVVNIYTDELNISGQAGSSGFLASNYDISYTAGDYSVTRRAAELVIGSDKRYAGALYQINPTAFTTIDLDGDTILPNGESVDSLAIMSLNGVAENPGAMMGLYPGEFVADPTSALGSNGFSLSNYNLTVIPGDFEIKPFPGLAAMSQDLSQEQWILDKIGYDSIDPFANSYAISQSVGVRLLSLDSWAKLSASKKQTVLSSLDAVPLHLQTLDLAEKLIEEIK